MVTTQQPGDAFYEICSRGMKRLIEREFAKAGVKIPASEQPRICSESGALCVPQGDGWVSGLDESGTGTQAALWFERRFGVRIFEIF